MEEIKVKAIVLKAIDYKEKDKLLNLFSLENGRLTAGLKGVKSPKAKLKFAGEPLNLTEYTLINRNGKYTVTTASLISSFFSIATNYLSFTCACIMQEIINKVLNEGEENSEIFVLTLKCFNLMQQKPELYAIVLGKFYLQVLKILGFEIKFDSCLNCGKSFEKDAYFSFDNGSFVCSGCKNFYDVLVKENQLKTLCALNKESLESLSEASVIEVDAFLLNVLNKNLEMRCLTKIKSFAQLNLH